ncbi:MAG: hypothetical protein A3J10_02490 [Candidatus Sungbacteria bacterium RIFCSPLOWO2_02_FULL_54_10]|uniref:Serine protease n=2 Tax=Candidatus Sungiibacteriota TaxID=1817917 RepID=A0A1G2L741_9BACT|nr:MAG: hypothetical protein A2679_02255 [Candidatus Sungbacteria bacterium RIFCSPHIGHO2_01_FULL_54_26]OHA03223.1 MAG: hypothetical protein A3C92_01800 [Candidatus Sungbacteria bacterium RIFCSPHIGHO2_02_FULL_53_17]OHA06559.1 MAG: hypothetical protein A3B34_01450 [Candidatus Sungbacteria bacterium RIFCSPLOWO2_01_FULL_54_21]OHA13799.1 MAG: hypothetical protein A3J10_02490 [Candidatus Sungbacteria bacterium RIFCSPLOWO2_02_FULL_54_10]
MAIKIQQINGKEDVKKVLQAIADKENASVFTFIASEKLIRTGPGSYGATSITNNDLYALEDTIDKNCTDIKSAIFLIHSPGGNLSSSYNIARFLRNRFDTLSFYVPYEAASGATIMSLAGNSIVLGALGYLTPIDPQVKYKGEWVSSYGIVEKVSDLERRFQKSSYDEIPTPWKQMIDRLDLIHYRELETLAWEAKHYAMELLRLADYTTESAEAIAENFARTIFPHSHCFDSRACIRMGLKIDETEKSLGYLKELKGIIHFVNSNHEDINKHYIEVAIPNRTTASAVESGRLGQAKNIRTRRLSSR